MLLFCIFFRLVWRRISSPYHRLGDWKGVACHILLYCLKNLDCKLCLSLCCFSALYVIF
jgi:hypothetical protein